MTRRPAGLLRLFPPWGARQVGAVVRIMVRPYAGVTYELAGTSGFSRVC